MARRSTRMSVLIKGMDMPKSCKECSLMKVNWAWFHCDIVKNNKKPLDLEDKYENLMYSESRHPDCPLVEVPAPHGDLIDRDKLLKSGITAKAAMQDGEGCVYMQMNGIIDSIKRAPTIIEAEE